MYYVVRHNWATAAAFCKDVVESNAFDEIGVPTAPVVSTTIRRRGFSTSANYKTRGGQSRPGRGSYGSTRPNTNNWQPPAANW
jgi:hypothetical protein